MLLLCSLETVRRFLGWACRYPAFPIFDERMTRMAGRRPKDPSGEPLRRMNLAVTKALRTAIEDGARDHGMSYVDYLGSLVALERGLPDIAPPLQEVLPKSA